MICSSACVGSPGHIAQILKQRAKTTYALPCVRRGITVTAPGAAFYLLIPRSLSVRHGGGVRPLSLVPDGCSFYLGQRVSLSDELAFLFALCVWLRPALFLWSFLLALHRCVFARSGHGVFPSFARCFSD